MLILIWGKREDGKLPLVPNSFIYLVNDLGYCSEHWWLLVWLGRITPRIGLFTPPAPPFFFSLSLVLLEVYSVYTLNYNKTIATFVAFFKLLSYVKFKILLNSWLVLVVFWMRSPTALWLTPSTFGKWKVLRWYIYQVTNK